MKRKIFEKIIWLKIYQNRTLGLIGLFTSVSVIYLLFDRLGITLNLNPYLTLLLGFIILTGIGWLDIKLGLFQTEMDINNKNLEIHQILEKLSRIEERLK